MMAYGVLLTIIIWALQLKIYVICIKFLEEQDAFAARSQQRAEAAIAAGKFENEIVAVEIPQRKGEPLLSIKMNFHEQV